MQALERNVQALEGQKPVRVVVRTEVEITQHRRRDPAGAEFFPGKCFPVQDQAVVPGALQRPGGRRTRGSTANDDDVSLFHWPVRRRFRPRRRRAEAAGTRM